MNHLTGQEERKGGIYLNHLVGQAKKRDKQSFVDLIELHKQSMYKVAWSYLHNDEDAADAIQETILKCYEKIDKLKNESYFTTWLIRILINNCKDILQKKKKETLSETFPEQGDVCRELENYEFQELLKMIDEKYRLVLLLYYGEGFKIREIAQILEMDENTVKTRLARGRREFGRVYEAENHQNRQRERSKICV